MVHYTSSSRFAMTLDGPRWQTHTSKHTSTNRLRVRRKRMARMVLHRHGVVQSCETPAECFRRRAHAALKLSALAQSRARVLFQMADEAETPDPFCFVNMDACVVAP